MADTTDRAGLPYPEPADTVDVPADLEALAERVAALLGAPPRTKLQRDALDGDDRYAGRLVWQSDDGVVEAWDGTGWTSGPRPVQMQEQRKLDTWETTSGLTVLEVSITPKRVGNQLLVQASVPLWIRAAHTPQQTASRVAQVLLRKDGSTFQSGRVGHDWLGGDAYATPGLLHTQTVTSLATQVWSVYVVPLVGSDRVRCSAGTWARQLVVQEVQL